MQIDFRGTGNTNSSSRNGVKPVAIVDHVVAGSGSSCDSWFRSSGNGVSSAHFLVWEDGRVTQYVDIRKMAWANGLSIDRISKAKSSLVRSKPATNPNLYTISIEHAGFTGKLTDAQLSSSIKLHQWLRDEVKRIFGNALSLDRTHVIGHFEIDPTRKPNCPGPQFPWDALIKGINGQAVVNKPTTPSSNVLMLGDKGQTVKNLQQNLLTLGIKLPKFGADGHYGQESVNGVKAFQKKHLLAQDGIAGPQVMSKIAILLKPVKSDHIGVVRVLVKSLNVRKEASFNSGIVKEIYLNDRYKVYTEKNGLYNLGGSQWCSAGKQYVEYTPL